MHLTSLSLYAAIWLTSTTFSLVAHPLNLQRGADKAPKYPDGYDAQSCPLGSLTVILMGSPARSKALPQPASVPRAPKLAMTRRVPPPAEAQVCQQIAQLFFTGATYAGSHDGHTLEVENRTPLHPGLYALMVTGNRNILGLSVVESYGGLPHPPNLSYEAVRNNPFNSLGYVFRLDRMTVLKFDIRMATTDTVGQVVVFKLDPDGWRAAHERMGLHVPRRLRS